MSDPAAPRAGGAPAGVAHDLPAFDGLPLPQPDLDTAAFWARVDERRFAVQRCVACGAYRHPPRPRCPECLSERHEWVESAGRGTVFTFTVVRHAVHASLADDVPYAVAVVELDDCGHVLVTGNLAGPPDDAVVGEPVDLVWRPTRAGGWLYGFRPRRLDGTAPAGA